MSPVVSANILVLKGSNNDSVISRPSDHCLWAARRVVRVTITTPVISTKNFRGSLRYLPLAACR